MRHSSASVWTRIVLSLKTYWPLLLFCAFGFLIRVWNLRNSLYFIYDQGRDALVLSKLAHGDFVLVGPTSGLQGFFLGPLWYYLGLPGFWLSQGNPYGISLWYIFLSCLSLPLGWWLSHRLFSNKWIALLSSVVLAVTPGPVISSLTIWNPLIAAPLLLGFVFALTKSLAGGKWRLAWLAVAYLLLGLTLQSEFAYAIFFIGPAVVFYPWLRGKVDRSVLLKELAVMGASMAITFAPQVLFDLRNEHLLSVSLLHGVTDHSKTISWQKLVADRPYQLWGKTSDLLIGDGQTKHVLLPFLLATIVVGAVVVLWQNRRAWPYPQPANRLWLIVLGGAIFPYIGFSLWRGNEGNFFYYYLTPHFVFLLPLFIRGLQWGLDQTTKIKMRELGLAFCAGVLLLFAGRSISFWQASVNTQTNNGGMAKMIAAVDQVYDWRKATDQSSPFIVRVFTANRLTENYDYLLQWRAQQQQLPVPGKTRDLTEKEWYLIIQSRPAADDYFFQPWYYEATKGGTLRQSTQYGVVTVEKWSL